MRVVALTAGGTLPPLAPLNEPQDVDGAALPNYVSIRKISCKMTSEIVFSFYKIRICNENVLMS
jgi:hypothetical protein